MDTTENKEEQYTKKPTAEEIVKALADWSNKYPKEKVHSMSNRVPMDNELYRIEDLAKQFEPYSPPMDTTENKTEHFIKKPYPEFKPEKAGVPYTTDLGELAYYVGLGAEGSFESKNGLLPTWFMEPISPPMEVKDAEEIEDVIPNPIKDLIREVIMRQGLAFPETEQDLKWSEQKPDHELMVRLFEYLKLGDGIEGDIRNNKDFWNKSDTAKTYLENPKPHYFVRHNLDKNDRFCDKCGLYFTDKIHLRTLI